mmetsp:Transcript_3004/g.5078  ORF Transcript_3004/g.5078 Transcript_3004/m.5078 type:complete len:250 (+) Transcript_3004:63-812(+)
MGRKKEKKEEDKEESEEETEDKKEDKKAGKSKKEKSKEKEKEKDDRVAKKTNLGDSGTMKRMLDDAAIKVVLESSELGYEEDTALSNVKLIIGFAGVGASLLSHVYPAPFPKNWWVLLGCCAWYFIASGILQLLLSFVELESILLMRGKRDGGKRTPGFNMSSHFPRFQEFYTLGITPVPNGSLGLPWAPKFKPFTDKDEAAPANQRQWSVSSFFDDEGFFYEELFCDAVREFIQGAVAGVGAENKKIK